MHSKIGLSLASVKFLIPIIALLMVFPVCFIWRPKYTEAESYVRHERGDWELHNSSILRKDSCKIPIIVVCGLFPLFLHLVMIFCSFKSFIFTSRYSSALQLFAQGTSGFEEQSREISLAHLMNGILLSSLGLATFFWMYRIFLIYNWEDTPYEKESVENYSELTISREAA